MEQIETISAARVQQFYETLKADLIVHKQFEQYKQIDASFANQPKIMCLKLINELNIGITFFIIDLCAIMRANDMATTKYENNFYARSLYGSCIEAYKFMYYFKGTKEKIQKQSLWNKIKDFVDNSGDDVFIKRYEDISEQLLKTSECFDKDTRNVIFHYDEDIIKVYDMFNVISYTMVSNKIANPLATILNEMQLFLNEFQTKIIKEKDNNFKYEDQEFITKPTTELKQNFILSFYKDKKGLLKMLEDTINTVVKKVSYFKKEVQVYKNMEIFMDKLQIQSPLKDEIQKIQHISKTHLWINFMLGDICCCLKAYLTSEFDAEFMLNLRRVIVTKVSALSHLIGYEESERTKSHLQNLATIIPNNQEFIQIKELLEGLLSNDDKEKRHLFVHYTDKGISKIPQLIETLGESKPLDYLKETLQLMRNYNLLTNFLGKAIYCENGKIKELQEKLRNNNQ